MLKAFHQPAQGCRVLAATLGTEKNAFNPEGVESITLKRIFQFTNPRFNP